MWNYAFMRYLDPGWWFRICARKPSVNRRSSRQYLIRSYRHSDPAQDINSYINVSSPPQALYPRQPLHQHKGAGARQSDHCNGRGVRQASLRTVHQQAANCSRFLNISQASETLTLLPRYLVLTPVIRHTSLFHQFLRNAHPL